MSETNDAVTIEFDEATGVAHLWLNRPDGANAVDPVLATAFHAAIDAIGAWEGARVVLIRGRGKMFSGGGDVKAFAPEPSAVVPAVLDAWHPALLAMLELDVPVIAATHSAVAGAGFGLVAAADLVIAARGSKFVLAFTGIGLTPDSGSTWFLPRLVGHHRAAELVLLNRPLSADEALSWGIVNMVVDDDALGVEAEALAVKVAAGPTRSYAAARRLLRGTWSNDVRTQMDAEHSAMVTASQSADGKEGVNAYVERRPAAFRGQ